MVVVGRIEHDGDDSSLLAGGIRCTASPVTECRRHSDAAQATHESKISSR